MAVGDKAWALNQLRHGRQTYLYTLASMRLLDSPATKALAGQCVVLTANGIFWNPGPAAGLGHGFLFDADQAANTYQHDHSNFSASLEELYKFVRRNVITEAFEVSKTYANYANVVQAWQSAPWYQFARVVRNAMSHNFIITFDRTSLPALPITCFGKTIDASAAGTEITVNVLDPYVTIQLLDAIRDFITTY